MTTDLKGLLARIVGLLDAAGVPFMIAGSFASAVHGLPRTTQDLDVVIDPAGPEALDAQLRTNVLGTHQVVRMAIAHMRTRSEGGRILMCSSVLVCRLLI